jgi:hypothetical protein
MQELMMMKDLVQENILGVAIALAVLALFLFLGAIHSQLKKLNRNLAVAKKERSVPGEAKKQMTDQRFKGKAEEPKKEEVANSDEKEAPMKSEEEEAVFNSVLQEYFS